MTTTLILNPYAGRWGAARQREQVQRELQAAGVVFQPVVTERRGHAVELTQRAVEAGATTIIGAGGDGTISEVINGLCLSGADPQKVALGILPIGTGNDLAYAFNLPLDLRGACKVIAARRTQALDIGRVTWTGDKAGTRYFGNNAGLGLEATISITNEQMVRLRGKVRYIVAALREIQRGPRWKIQLKWDAGTYNGPAVLVSIGNTRRTGGSFFMHPNARHDDGQFEFLHGQAGRPRLLQLLPLALRGTHLGQPEIFSGRTRRLEVSFSPPTPIQCDGENVSYGAHSVVFEMMPGHVSVCAP